MKNIFTLLLLALSFSVYAQSPRAGVKLNLSALAAPRFIEGQFEYLIDDNKGIQLSIGVIPSTSKLRFHNFIDEMDKAAKDKAQTGETTVFSGMKQSAFRVTADMRFYLGEGEGTGFYLSPFIRYYKYTFKSKYKEDVNADKTIEAWRDFKLKTNVSAVGIGLAIGTQWLINDKWAIDVTWIGIAPSFGKIKATVTSDDNVDWKKYTDDFNNSVSSDDSKFVQKIKATSSKNGISLSFPNPVPVILRSGVSVGYYF